MIYHKAVELCESDDDIQDVLALAFDDENVRQYVPRDPVSGDVMTPRSFMVAVQSHVNDDIHDIVNSSSHRPMKFNVSPTPQGHGGNQKPVQLVNL